MAEPTKKTYPELLWAGSEHSLTIAMEAHGDTMMAGFGQTSPMPEEETPYMLSIQGDVGVISIRGPMVNRDSEWNRYAGVSSYADIRRAVIHAAQNPAIKGILLDVESGGGAVSGVADTADLIKSVDRQIKPVWAYTDGQMASAAYWVGSSARKIYSSKTSIVGSIGVIATHMEYSKQLKAAGVGVTVVRAGEYKALANSVEPLTETAQRQLQDQLNSAYGIFIGHVADARGTTVAQADQKMGQGREFFGEDAVAAGLVDGIKSFDEVLGQFADKVLDTKGLTQNNSGKYYKGTDMTKKALTAQEIAALASGAPVVQAAAGGGAPAGDDAAAAEAAAAATAAAAAAVAAAALAPAPAATAPVAPAAPAVPDQSVLTFLQGQISAGQDQILDLRLQLKAATDQVASMKVSHDGLMAIAAHSVSNMKVALGLPAVDLTKVAPESLLADHAATAESFTNAFKAGGVAAVNTGEPASKTSAVLDPKFAAIIAANRYTARK